MLNKKIAEILGRFYSYVWQRRNFAGFEGDKNQPNLLWLD